MEVTINIIVAIISVVLTIPIFLFMNEAYTLGNRLKRYRKKYYQQVMREMIAKGNQKK